MSMDVSDMFVHNLLQSFQWALLLHLFSTSTTHSWTVQLIFLVQVWVLHSPILTLFLLDLPLSSSWSFFGSWFFHHTPAVLSIFTLPTVFLGTLSLSSSKALVQFLTRSEVKNLGRKSRATTALYLRSHWIERRESGSKQHRRRRVYFKHPGKFHVLSFLSAIWILMVSYFCYSKWYICQPMQTWISAYLLRLTVSSHDCPQGVPSDPKTTWLSNSASYVHMLFGLTHFGTSVHICFNHLWPKAKSNYIISCPFKILSGTVSSCWGKKRRKCMHI